MPGNGAGVGEPLTDGKWVGWTRWVVPHPGTFMDAIGQSLVMRLSPGRAHVALETRPAHRNRRDALHGGFLAAFADHAYFGALWGLGLKEQVNGVTVDLSMQYLSGGTVGADLLADVELLKETRRLLFMRMLITQDGQARAASAATIRKVPSGR